MSRRDPRAGDDSGSVSLEFVLLTPVLVILVVLMLWAGGTGQARLVADLAAEEAVTAAALCCDSGDEDRQERVVEAILSGRPELSRLCIAEPRPLGDRFVSHSAVALGAEEGDAPGGVSVLAVGFSCETDGGVGGPGAIFGNTEIRGRASEVVLLSPEKAQGDATRPVLTVADVATDERFDSLTFVLELSRPVAPGREISLFYRLHPFEADPASVLNAEPAVTGDQPFDFCAASVQDILDGGGTYDPAAFAGRQRDYLKTTGNLLIPRGETSETVSVPILDDCLHEADESFRLELYNENEEDVLIVRGEAVGTIRDDDGPPFVAFSDTSETLREDAADRRLTLDIALLSPTQPDHHPTISVFPVSGTVVTYDDDATASGSPDGVCPPDFVAIASDDPAGAFPNLLEGRGNQVVVEILDDDIYEGEEFFEVRLHSANGAVLGPDGVVRVTIRDDDPQPFLAFIDSNGARLGSFSVPEDAGEVRLAVGLVDRSRNRTSSGIWETFSVSFDDRGGATGGQDYEPGAESGGTIAPCADVSDLPEIAFTIVDDNRREPDEWFLLRLTSDNGTAKAAQISVTIEDND